MLEKQIIFMLDSKILKLQAFKEPVLPMVLYSSPQRSLGWFRPCRYSIGEATAIPQVRIIS